MRKGSRSLGAAVGEGLPEEFEVSPEEAEGWREACSYVSGKGYTRTEAQGRNTGAILAGIE